MSNPQTTNDPETFFEIPMEEVIITLGQIGLNIKKLKDQGFPMSMIDDEGNKVNKWRSIINIRQKEYIDIARIFCEGETISNSDLLKYSTGVCMAIVLTSRRICKQKGVKK